MAIILDLSCSSPSLLTLYSRNAHYSMAPSATFCNIPLSTSVDNVSATSLVSLDWIMTTGIPAPRFVASGILTLPCGNTMCSMHTKLYVTPDLPYDLVLGRDWLFFCRETLPHTSFDLSSGTVSPGHRLACPPDLSGHPASHSNPMDVDTQCSMNMSNLYVLNTFSFHPLLSESHSLTTTSLRSLIKWYLPFVAPLERQSRYAPCIGMEWLCVILSACMTRNARRRTARYE